MNADTFILLILELFRLVPCSLTSWFRTEERNEHIGGAANSKHLDARAADLVPDDPNDREALGDAAIAAGLLVRYEVTHVHVEAPD